jgi:tRNA pseudouridine38-40 synthase
MQQGANYLVGTHDFTSFCTNKPEYKDHVRTIYSLDVTRSGDMITVRIRGNGFLYNMVRIIVGTLLQVGSQKIAPETVGEILASRDRGQAGDTARPQGLTLVKIEYPEGD